MEQWQQGLAYAHTHEVAESAVPVFRARPFEQESDYALAAAWWTQHHWPVVPQAALPALGIVVECDVASLEGWQPLCVSFMYRDSGWGYIAWTVGDADASRMLRAAAVDFAIATLTALGDEFGITWLYTSTRNPAMQDRYTRCGWTACEQDFQTFIRVRPQDGPAKKET